MLGERCEDNKIVAARLGKVHNVCDEHRDIATASLIEVWIDETKLRTWFLFEADRPWDATGVLRLKRSDQRSCMGLFTLEHSKMAYRADFALYGVAVLSLATLLVLNGPAAQRVEIALWVLAGLAGWSLVEYVLHRFVLHGLQPFQGWHAEHHERPTALICAPTLLSAALIATLVFLPALLLGGVWRACAVTLGVVTGYLAYAIIHHATHHWRADSPWLRERKRWHALHHHKRWPGCYGVTSGLWDHAFATAHRTPRTPRAEALTPP